MSESFALHQEAAPGEGIGGRDRWHHNWTKAQALYPARAHSMPVPTWAARGFTDHGATAWDRLTRIVPERRGSISIYAHIPFCRSRCPFCDCHATTMPRKSRAVVEQYVHRFHQEAEQWSRLGGLAQRPVTTVHLGGGTPHALSMLEFDRMVQTLAHSFSTKGSTEWAIETNGRCLDDEHTDQLASLGFTRIHVGVQTLRASLRSMLGRRDTPKTVLARIDACLRRGWIVSVDMLYGLPEQTTTDLLDDLQLLVTAGIHGVSLYRLNHGSYNHRFMVRHRLAERGANHLYADYWMFMAAAGQLAAWGYTKNHFTHFAREQDQNLYSRHALRGEDLLALGATADGVFGDYYYRHGALMDYVAGRDERVALEGGGYFTLAEQRARGLVSQLMSGQVLDRTLDQTARRFVRKLADADLLCANATPGAWKLTDTGSWFIGECTADALRIYADPSHSDAICPITDVTEGGAGSK